MSERKRVLILTADAGFGHRSAANALAAALEDAHHDTVEVEIVNPFDDPTTPSILRDAQENYDSFVRQMPDFYKLNYTISDSPVPAAVMERALTVMMIRTFRNLLKSVRPAVIVSTHPFYMAPVSSYISLTRRDISLVNVATDLTNVHRLWFNTGADLLALPTQEAYEQGVASGFPEERMVVTGIPVNPAINNETRSPDEVRAELGWAPGVTTALVIGSKRIKGLMDVLHVLNHSGLPVQFVLVAGGDDELFEQFKATEWHASTHVYNYVSTMPQFMRAADFLVGKAGGLTVTEALASGKPMIIVDVTPGQEEGNVAYMVQHGAADLAETPIKALETMFHWLDRDRQLLDARAAIACQLGRSCAAYDIARMTLEVADKKHAPSPSTLQEATARVKELLRTFDISLDDRKS